MFDPQMLQSLFSSMNFANNQGDNNSLNNMTQNNPLFSMMGANPSMLSGLMQMFNNNSNSTNNQTTGKNTYVSNKISDKKNINSELYHLIKNADSIM